MGKLPLDIIEEILAGLPAKSLLRFRSVSKGWCYLISDPRFVRFHLKQARIKDDPKYLVRAVESQFYTVDCGDDNADLTGTVARLYLPSQLNPDGEDDSRVYPGILGCCDGLLWLSSEYYGGGRHLIWNPCTKESRELPSPGPSSIDILSGLGYHPSADDYKVIRGEAKGDLKVFSLKDGVWRSIISLLDYSLAGNHAGLTLNGAVHWLMQRKDNNGSGSYIILAFDLESEELREMPLPFSTPYKLWSPRNIDGHLSVVHLSDDWRGSVVWSMKKYGVDASWTKRIFRSPTGSYLNLNSCFTKNEVLWWTKNGELFRYNLGNRALRKSKLQVGGFPEFANPTFIYFETLLSTNPAN